MSTPVAPPFLAHQEPQYRRSTPVVRPRSGGEIFNGSGQRQVRILRDRSGTRLCNYTLMALYGDLIIEPLDIRVGSPFAIASRTHRTREAGRVRLDWMGRDLRLGCMCDAFSSPPGRDKGPVRD